MTGYVRAELLQRHLAEGIWVTRVVSAVAANLVRPGTQVVSVSGDGGFLMSAMELETARRLSCTFTHVLMRDNALNMIQFQQILRFGRTFGAQLHADVFE
jgi:thiamine pyrophosphate-dependent acetolactate synthase large subunit-like protein